MYCENATWGPKMKMRLGLDGWVQREGGTLHPTICDNFLN